MKGQAISRPNPQGDIPRVDESAFIDPSAVVLGNVLIKKNVFVGPGAVIRADESGSYIEIGDDCNIQDRVVIHALGDASVIVGRRVSLSHACIVHGPCGIGPGCFIGFGSVVFNAVLGERVIVRHLAIVEGITIEPGKMVDSASKIETQDAANNLKEATNDLAEFASRVVNANLELLDGYKRWSGMGDVHSR